MKSVSLSVLGIKPLVKAVVGSIAMVFLLSSCTSVEPQFESSDGERQADTRTELGMTYLRLGQLNVAEQEFNKALSLSSKADGAYHGLGLIAAQRKEPALAQSFFAKAVRLNSHNLQAASDYAIVLCRDQKVDKGLSVLDEVKNRALSGRDLGVSLAFGGCYLAANQYSDAEQAYTRVLNVSPRLEQALLPMMEIKRKLGKLLAARAYVERYFGAGYSSPKALIQGAEVERLLDNQAQQKRYLDMLWTRYPGSPEARAARE